MTKGRLEAFSDGVIAIIITIMVLELRPPEHAAFEDLVPLWPKLISYVLSFVFVAIYWNNHHHLLQAAHHIDGRVLWANMHLLFWLSLVPFGTSWMGETSFDPISTAAYGVIVLMPAVAFTLLVVALTRVRGQSDTIATSLGRDYKGKVSLMAYLVAIPVALFAPFAAVAIFAAVAALWFVPDRRFERTITE